MSRIKVYGKYGDPRSLAAKDYVDANDPTPHGFETSEIEELHRRMSAFDPKLVNAGVARRDILEEILPDGATLDPINRRRGQAMPGMSVSTSGGNGTSISSQRVYNPEFDSPDRQQYPIHRILANRYWRMFYKMDPLVHPCINMISDLVWSDFQLTGEGVDGEIKDRLELMCEETEVRSKLPYLVREFLVVGEACPHLIYDQTERLWTHLTLHNPDQLEVIYTPLVKMDPIVEFVPDDKLRQVVTSSHPMLRRIRESMPPELVSRLTSRQNIPLSPTNFTFIPRKLHDYEVRGTSLLSTLWRTFMAEDALWSSFIATSRRAASPLKVAKVGDPATNYIPGPEQERKLLQLLTQAELDPQSWLVFHYGVQFELAGAPERVMGINNNYDLIERIKLIALGVSKSFLHGEVTYASAAAGLSIFLQRLLSMRQYFESKWLMPKFFKQISVANKWIKPTESEVGTKGKGKSQGPWIRTRRSHREVIDDKRYIIPTIEWEKSLDPAANSERISALAQLEGSLGVKVSRRTKLATVGLDFETELQQIKSEVEIAKKIVGNNMELAAAAGILLPGMAPGPQDGAGGGGGGGFISPGMPPESTGLGDEGGEGGGMPNATPPGAPAGGDTVNVTPTPEGASKGADAGQPTKPGPIDSKKPATQELASALQLFTDFDHAEVSEPWDRFVYDSRDAQSALKSEDSELLWQAMERWMIEEGFPTRVITDLQAGLVDHGKIEKVALTNGHSNEVLNKLEEIASGVGNSNLYTGI